MKRYIAYLSLMAAAALLAPGASDAAVHFGLPSAVKSTVKKLSAKVPAKKASYTLAANAVVLSQQTNSYLVNADTTTQIYYYASQAAEVAALTPGKIIISTQGNGFLRKVDSVIFNGSQYEVRTSTASMEDAFEELDISFTKELLPQDVIPQGFYQAKGVSFRPSATISKEWEVKIDSAVLYDLDGNHATTYDQIYAVGTLKFTATAEGVVKIHLAHIEEVKIQGTIIEDADVKVKWATSVGLSLPESLESITLGLYPLNPITIPIVIPGLPPVPLVVVPVITVVVGAKGEINLSCTAETGISQHTSYSAGAWYKNNSWSPINDFHSDFTYTPPNFSYDVSASIKTYAGPKLNLKFYNFAGPTVSVDGYLDAAAEGIISPPSINWSLYGGLEGIAKGEVKIFSFYLETPDINLFDYRVLIASGTIQPAPTTPSSLSAVAVSSSQINLTWQDNSNNEDGFKIERKTGAGGTYAQIAAPNTDVVSYSNTSLAAGTTYYYRVRAYNSGGDSAYSTEASTVTLPTVSSNHAPVISSLTANPATVSTGAVTTITCAASDADADTLTYNWTAASGTITGTGSQVTWTAPVSSDTYSITCIVSDGKGGSAQQSVNINVAASTGHELPDTGQYQSYTATSGEDHNYQPAASQPSYADNGDGTTTDNKTGLMWVKDGNSAGCNSGGTLMWEAALNFCEGLTYAGYSDWRLPNVRELESIIDAGQSSPAINTTYFPNTQSSWYWTSTTYVPNTDYAWYVNFYDGSVNYNYKAVNYYVRCVRAGP